MDELHDPRTLLLARRGKEGKVGEMAPKFGMEMDEFKASLPKDDRVPALKDRRIVEAMQKARAAMD